MDERDGKKAFIQGFKDGVSTAFGEVEKMLARGYTNQELKMMVGSRKAAVLKDIDAKMRELGLADDPSDPGAAGLPRLERGDSVIVLEKHPRDSIALLNSLMEKGAKGLAIIRMDPDRFRRSVKDPQIPLKWLSSITKGNQSRRIAVPLGLDISPEEAGGSYDADEFYVKATELSRIDVEAKRFFDENEGGVFYLEGIEYLVTQNKFQGVLKFIQHIREMTVVSQGHFIVSLDEKALDSREISLIEREFTYKHVSA